MEEQSRMASKRSLGVSYAVLRKKFRTGVTFRNYRDKEVVFSQGDSADSVFYIESGTVKLTAVTTRKKSHNRHPTAKQFFWRRLSSRAISADLHGEINWTIQYHSTAKEEHGSHAQARPAVCNDVRWILTFTGCSNRGRPDRSILQFQRKAARSGSVVVWGYNQGIEVGLSPEAEPINPGGDGRYYPPKGK
jgi:hypothetical protein